MAGSDYAPDHRLLVAPAVRARPAQRLDTGGLGDDDDLAGVGEGRVPLVFGAGGQEPHSTILLEYLLVGQRRPVADPRAVHGVIVAVDRLDVCELES